MRHHVDANIREVNFCLWKSFQFLVSLSLVLLLKTVQRKKNSKIVYSLLVMGDQRAGLDI